MTETVRKAPPPPPPVEPPGGGGGGGASGGGSSSGSSGSSSSSSSSGSSAPAVDPIVAQKEALFRSIYIDLWGEPPTVDYLKAAANSGMNSYEFEQHERMKPAFQNTPTYAKEADSLIQGYTFLQDFKVSRHKKKPGDKGGGSKPGDKYGGKWGGPGGGRPNPDQHRPPNLEGGPNYG